PHSLSWTCLLGEAGWLRDPCPLPTEAVEWRESERGGPGHTRRTMWSNEDWNKLTSHVLLYLPRVGTALAVLLVFWLAARSLRHVVERMTKLRRLDADLTRYLGRAAYVVLLLLGLLTALGTIGVDVTALVAGLGLTTFAVGFAMKDILSNALSGILVLL